MNKILCFVRCIWIFWILSYIGTVLVLYNFTTTFVTTVSCGLFLVVLSQCFAFQHPCGYCVKANALYRTSHRKETRSPVKDAFTCSCFFIFCGLIFSLGTTGLQYGHNVTNCYFYECCDTRWIPANISGLSFQLNKKLYGQHLVILPLVKHLRGRFDGQPQKATVLSFHGLPGTGKTFVSRIVAENVYAKGMNSKYVHFLSATKDFPHESRLEDYKDKLKQKIETAVHECPQSLFIIDEIDKLHPGLIDTIRPYIDMNAKTDGTDYRQSIFIFLSNTGGNAVAKEVIRHYQQGGTRRSLSYREMEEIVRESAFNEPNGLYQSNVVKNSLVTGYIPFLPLERKHVIKCIVDGLFAKGFYEFEYQVDKDIVEMIANELLYFPERTQLFSTTGCKRVMEKIDLVMQDAGEN